MGKQIPTTELKDCFIKPNLFPPVLKDTVFSPTVKITNFAFIGIEFLNKLINSNKRDSMIDVHNKTWYGLTTVASAFNYELQMCVNLPS